MKKAPRRESEAPYMFDMYQRGHSPWQKERPYAKAAVMMAIE